MKKFKKVFAVLLTLAMILGMSMTSFAATPQSKEGGKIKVSNLSKETTVVNVYQIATLDIANSKWVIPAWVPSDMVETKNGNVIGIKTLTEEQWETLKGLAYNNKAELTQLNTYTNDDENNIHGYVTSTGSWESNSNLPIGLYLVTAAGTTTSYKMMAGLNYNYGSNDNGLITADDATITAKPETYKLTKTYSDEQSAKVVKRGDTLSYTITGYVPVFENSNNKEYWISDTPTNLTLKNITVDGLTANTDYEIYKGTVDVAQDGKATFTKDGGALTIGTAGAIEVDESQAIAVIFTKEYLDRETTVGGTRVVVNVTAQATGDPTVNSFTGYNNTTNSNHASGPDTPPTGTTGSLTINKTDDSESNPAPLNGAKFQIRRASDTTPLYFVQVGTVNNGVVTYKLALSNAETDGNYTATQTVGDDNASTIKLVGLDQETYHITEIEAPDGYSINDTIADATIPTSDSIDVTSAVKDMKLSGLPSTGGIGTTIFTIGGCAIMIIAAALFFASRRKAAK